MTNPNHTTARQELQHRVNRMKLERRWSDDQVNQAVRDLAKDICND